MAGERDKTADRVTPLAAELRNQPVAPSARAEIDAFIQRVRGMAPAAEAGKRGRLIFALDATMSRQPTWDTACRLQGEMFRETGAIGGLDVQLLYFRGLDECRAHMQPRLPGMRRHTPRAVTPHSRHLSSPPTPDRRIFPRH